MLFPELKGNIPNFGELLAPSKDIGGVSYEKKSPRPHQKEAVRDLVNALSVSGSDVRTQGIMACGTGKTMVALWVAEKMQAKKTLLAEPSLALISQNLKEWQANSRGPRPEILVVCSDETVVKPNRDEIKVDLRDIPARVTNSPEEIARFLKNGSERKILMSTYHSLPLLGKAMETRGTGSFDLGVADEAHRTASKQDGAFTLFHYQEVIRSRSRLYLTATPKIYEGDNDLKISMDDESIFGKVGHSLPFSKAIELGLLADYRLIVATLPENILSTKNYSNPENYDAVKQLAVLKAIEKYHLSKVLSFHNSVQRAYAFADSLENSGPKFFANRSVWVHGVDGSMPSSTRSNLLKLMSERPKNAFSLISNCRCLTEGIDVPAIDGIVFFDPKKEGVDIVQAIGRAIRQSTKTNKEYGTIIVPLVVPENVESADFLDSSQYRHVAQVMRALRAHDDRFEIRAKDTLTDYQNNQQKQQRSSESVIFNAEGLSSTFIKSLSTKVLKIGAGIKGTLLFEKVIVEAAIEHFRITREWPTNGDSISNIPLLPGDSWSAIDAAGRNGGRGLEKGRTLAIILENIKREYGSKVRGGSLYEKIIVEAAIEHFKITGKWPTNRDSTSNIRLLPGENWAAISLAGSRGYRGLEVGRSLPMILESTKREFGSKVRVRGTTLTEAIILKAAILHFKKTGKWPTQETKGDIPLLPGDSWNAIDAAGRVGQRGLEQGRTLAKVLAPIKVKYGANIRVEGGALTEESIIKAAVQHFKKTGIWPSCNDISSDIPLLPGSTWRSINSSGKQGNRGLEKGRTLSKILAPIKEQYKKQEAEK